LNSRQCRFDWLIISLHKGIIKLSTRCFRTRSVSRITELLLTKILLGKTDVNMTFLPVPFKKLVHILLRDHPLKTSGRKGGSGSAKLDDLGRGWGGVGHQTDVQKKLFVFVFNLTSLMDDP